MAPFPNKLQRRPWSWPRHGDGDMDGEGRRKVASISAGEQLCAKPETNTICHDRDKRFRLSACGKYEGARLLRGLPESPPAGWHGPSAAKKAGFRARK